MSDLECCEGSLEEALEKIGYTGDIQASNFSAREKFMENEMPGVTATYNTDVQSVFAALLSDSASFVQQWRKSARGDKDFEEGNWMGGTNFSGVKLFKCNTRVKEFISWNWVIFSERQRFVLYKPPNGPKTLMVNFSSQTPTVTLGENFRIEALLEFTESGGGNSTTLKVYSHVHFMSSLGFIEGKVKSIGTSESIKSFKYFVELSPPAVKAYQGTKGQKNKQTKAKKVAAASAPAPAETPPLTPVMPSPMITHEEDTQNQLTVPLIAVSVCLFLLLIYIFTRSDLERLLMLTGRVPNSQPTYAEPSMVHTHHRNQHHAPPHHSHNLYSSERGADVASVMTALSHIEAKYITLKSSGDWYLSMLTIISFISLLVAVNSVRLQKQQP